MIFNTRLNLFLIFIVSIWTGKSLGQNWRQETYCNPLNLDYTYMIYNSHKDISYRSGADPSVVEFRGEYYMFVTRSHGYWHSSDLLHWKFIKPESWYFEGENAPTAFNYKDSVLYFTGHPSGNMNILYTDNPKKGDWKGTATILYDLQDPNLFIDDDGQAYMFWGSSNILPIRGKKLNKDKRFIPSDEIHELFKSDPIKHGWERFGENHNDTLNPGYIEGPWLTKYNNCYYMQYGAPGTEFNVYGDGVYVAGHPLGPYHYQVHNPVFYKPGGFLNGSGHGSTVVGPGGNYWHFATMDYSVNMNWERRISMLPTYFDKDGIMYSDSRFGDYPHYAPDVPHLNGQFRDWMLLSYNKPVSVSSISPGDSKFKKEYLTDEIAKTSWLAASNGSKEWVQIDLKASSNINAVQINFADYRSDMYGRYEGLKHRYIFEGSQDGKVWFILIDKSSSLSDTPNDYVEITEPKLCRYVRFNNIEVPTPYLNISEIRVFGTGQGEKPRKVQKVELDRKIDRRDILISWEHVNEAQGYHVLWGIASDKLYSAWLVYGQNQLELKALNKDQSYYFSIEPFNENGVGVRSSVQYVN